MRSGLDQRAAVRWAGLGLVAWACLALAGAPVYGQGSLRGVGYGPSTEFLTNLPSYELSPTSGNRQGKRIRAAFFPASNRPVWRRSAASPRSISRSADGSHA